MEWNVWVIKAYGITTGSFSNGSYGAEGNIIPDLFIIPASSFAEFQLQ
jgi:hypothetical protein